MKWGIRRYQNSDGSLTSAGKKRYGVEGGKKPKHKIIYQSPFEKKIARIEKKEKRMSEKEEIQRRKNELKERQAKLKNLGKSKETVKKENQSKPKSAKDLSDDDLRNFITRYNLEQQYNKIVNGPEKKKGSAVVKEILSKSATTVATKYATKAMESAVEAMLKKRRSSGGSGGGGST